MRQPCARGVTFTSLTFLCFLIGVLGVYYAGPRSWRGRKRWLLAASWAFYAAWSPAFLLVLVATTWATFQLALRLHATPDRRHASRLLTLGVGLNLGLLGFFKYARFLWDSAAAVAPLGPPPALLTIAAPLAISFYTFHAISYLIDTHRGDRPPTDDLGDFALYMAFFPQLIAGPITRWGFFGPQLERAPAVRTPQVDAALLLLMIGYLKKTVGADTLGVFVDRIHAAPGEAGWVEITIALYAYAFQIYFDFSGYTDIATGIAGLLGFRLPDNFRHPYRAENPSDFWRRWHVSLSTWLRDYLYIGLGGNRRGPARTYVNLLITMLLGGLWHGAAWTFVLWGAFHGAWLGLHRALREAGGAPRLPLWLRRTATFHLVVASWLLFRAGSLAAVGAMIDGIVSGRPASQPLPVGTLLLIACGLLGHFALPGVDRVAAWQRTPRVAQGLVYGAAIVLVGLCSAQSGRFIYFQF